MKIEELAKQAIPVTVLHPRARFVAFRGSVAQGLYEGGPDSDFDLTGFYPAEDSNYIGLGLEADDVFERKEGPWEAKYYEIRHMMRLLVKANPEVMQMLWTPPAFCPVVSHASGVLLANRSAFASKQVFAAFTGFATGQLTRMTRIDTEKASVKRLLTFARSGYDTKNAMHTVRTVRLATETLRTGGMTMDRREAGDAKELLSIKNGDWSLPGVTELIHNGIDDARAAHAESSLPATTDMREAEALCKWLIRMTVTL